MTKFCVLWAFKDGRTAFCDGLDTIEEAEETRKAYADNEETAETIEIFKYEEE